MNTNEPREPASIEGAQLGDDERVDVLVEDLFIEEYPPAIGEEIGEKRALAKGRRIMSGKGILGGIFALGIIGILAMLFARPKAVRKMGHRYMRMLPRRYRFI
jgi:hypothetical protein